MHNMLTLTWHRNRLSPHAKCSVKDGMALLSHLADVRLLMLLASSRPLKRGRTNLAQFETGNRSLLTCSSDAFIARDFRSSFSSSPLRLLARA